jgi:hypothetical protein
MARPSRAQLELLARMAVREARAGNHLPLIARVLSVPNAFLSEDERAYLRELLERHEGKRGKAELRRLEKVLTVEGLVAGDSEHGEPPTKVEAAVRAVMQHRRRSRSAVYAAYAQESKKHR